MHAISLLHKILKKSCVGIHTKRLDGLLIAVQSLSVGGKLSITGMGRSLKAPIKPKNKIKRIDRLVGNKKLHNERTELYKATAHWVIGHAKRIPIIIDWSWLPNVNYCLLRAAMPTQGRALTLYEEVHPKQKNNNHKIHKEFLKTLKTIIPQHCKPIIITDAGFHSPFFKVVENLGWDWIGRIRNLTKYRTSKEKNWISCKILHEKASKAPVFFSEVILSKSNPIHCSIFLYKGKKKGRVAKNKFGIRRKAESSRVSAASGREPWVLATSLKESSKKIVKLYNCRMQIEESFRDLKSSRLGLGFEDSQTYQQKRFEILLLVGMLSVLVLFLLGKAGEQRCIHYDFQANTLRTRAVLSIFYLGCQIIREGGFEFSESALLTALVALRTAAIEWEAV